MTSVVNRYYDPTTDQFMSVDPQVATTGQPYVFTNDNPLNATDPLGLMKCQWWNMSCHVASTYDAVATDLSQNGTGLIWSGIADVVFAISLNTAVIVACASTAAACAAVGPLDNVATVAMATGLTLIAKGTDDNVSKPTTPAKPTKPTTPAKPTKLTTPAKPAKKT